MRNTISLVGDGDGEFEGLKGGSRMMSLLTLFGGLKNVFKVKTYSTDTVVFRLHYKVNNLKRRPSNPNLVPGDDGIHAGLLSSCHRHPVGY